MKLRWFGGTFRLCILLPENIFVNRFPASFWVIAQVEIYLLTQAASPRSKPEMRARTLSFGPYPKEGDERERWCEKENKHRERERENERERDQEIKRSRDQEIKTNSPLSMIPDWNRWFDLSTMRDMFKHQWVNMCVEATPPNPSVAKSRQAENLSFACWSPVTRIQSHRGFFAALVEYSKGS